MNRKSIFDIPSYQEILTRIKSHEVKVGIVGVGYVGQALVAELIASGFKTYGFDIDKNKLLQINHRLFVPTSSIKQLSVCEVICICVPTPVDGSCRPDLTYLINAARGISSLNKRGELVVVESTVAPGALRNTVLPIFAERGRRCGEDFFLAISPERIDPGNRQFTLRSTPKVVGGVDKTSTSLAVEFYSGFVDKVVATTTAEVAELSKMLENTFRLVNISLVNEIKDYADSVGIDIWEVIEAASTKPFAFLAHYPGPGVGGHCIPVDPVYLLEEAKSKGINLNMVKIALEVNEIQPKKIVRKACEALNGYLKGGHPKMLVIGIAYKPNIGDTRESPGVKILEEAEREGFEVSYFDPYVPKLNGHTSKAMDPEMLLAQDVIVIATHHQNIPYELLTKINKPIIDTRNIMSGYSSNRFSRLGDENI